MNVEHHHEHPERRRCPGRGGRARTPAGRGSTRTCTCRCRPAARERVDDVEQLGRVDEPERHRDQHDRREQGQRHEEERLPRLRAVEVGGLVEVVGIAVNPASRITNMNGVHCHASARMREMYVHGESLVKSIVTGWPRTLPSSQFAGPKGLPQEQVEEAADDHRAHEERDHEQHHQARRPRNGRIMASARTKPSASSTATEIVARIAVTQSECTRPGRSSCP